MAHFGTQVGRAATSKEWLKHAAEVTEQVNIWADREDLVAYIGKDGGMGLAPALYDPVTAQIEVNTEIAFNGTLPGFIGDLTQRSVHFDFPAAAGAILHEAMHAKHTGFDMEKLSTLLNPMEFRALINILEESRIEGLGVKDMPKNRSFLRSCAMIIVLDSFELKDADELEEVAVSFSPTRQYSQSAGLILGRVDAGVLDESDVVRTRALIEANLSPELLASLRALWIEFQGLNVPDHHDRMLDVAREWVRLVEEAAEENGEPMPGDGTPDDSDGEGGSMSDMMRELADAIAEDADSAQIGGATEGSDQQEQEHREAETKKKNKAQSEKEENENVASKVFARGTGPLNADTASSLIETRTPTGEERAAAVLVCRELERAQYIERSKVVRGSIVPPGKLRMGSAIQAQAAKSNGVHTPVETWRQSQRKHNDSPPLTIGVMVDISGSMSAAMEPMAVTAWIISEATRRIDGTGAMVYYGNDVFATLRPGEMLPNVRVYSAPDGTEKFDRAFRALDGSLNLLQGVGARLLVIVSDGHYTPDEMKAAKKWLKRCAQEDVAVLWLGMDSRYGADPAEGICDPLKGQYHVKVGRSVTAAAIRIGQAGADAITRVGKGR